MTIDKRRGTPRLGAVEALRGLRPWTAVRGACHPYGPRRKQARVRHTPHLIQAPWGSASAHGSTSSTYALDVHWVFGSHARSMHWLCTIGIRLPAALQAGPSAIRGGCYLNNVAVAARAALAAGAQRVMVVDWDLHHGQGTSEIFWEDGKVLVVDAHLHSP